MTNYEEKLHLIERTDQLIRLNATGTASQLANTLGISRVSVFRLLKYLKSMGAPIKYCKYRKTYYYQYPVKLSISYEIFNLE